MSERVVKLLDLIDDECTINEIVSKLNISREEIYKLFRYLKTMGMEFNKKYYDNGDFIYLPKKELECSSKKNTVNIITNPGSEIFRALIISDPHFGSIYERKDILPLLMDYCTLMGIHNIIITGDFLDGINIGRPECKNIKNPIAQMEYAIKTYPFDSSIVSYLTFGNHDIDLLTSCGIDLSTFLQNFRHDIVPLGYGYGRINIKNDKIFVTHPLCIGVSKDIDLTSNYLLLKGHHHCTKSIIGNNGNCSLTVPSISNIFLTENEFMPGAIDLTIKFRGGYFDTIYYEHLLINDKVYTVSSTQYSITHPRDRKFDGPIKYEEDRTKKKNLSKKERTSIYF